MSTKHIGLSEKHRKHTYKGYKTSESHHMEATRAQERRTKTKEADEQRQLKKWRLHPGIRPSYGQKNNKLSILKQKTEQI